MRLTPSLGRTFLSFGAMQAAQLALPLIILPVLARKLDPEAFGLLMYMCLISPLTALFMDWGLAQGGARAAAQASKDNRQLAILLGNALAGRLILFTIAIISALILWPFIPYAREAGTLYWLAVVWGIVRGVNPVWFCQGSGINLGKLASRDVGASLIILLLAIILINSSKEAWIYLFLLASCKGMAFGSIWLSLIRGFSPPLSLRGGWLSIKDNSYFSGSSFSTISAYNGGQLILGYFLTAEVMGIIAACAKMIRALASLVNPVTQTLFPGLCKPQPDGERRRILRISLCACGFCAICAASLGWISSPVLMRIALNTSCADDIQVLRLMFLAVPLMVTNNILTQQILIPLGQEKAQLKIQILGICFCFAGACVLPALWGMAGGACLPMALEGFLACGFMLQIRKRCPQALFTTGPG